MGASNQQFAEYYRGLADEELLHLALQKDELLEAAASALAAEMASRALGDDALREFREPPHSEDEGESHVEPCNASTDNAVATELPPDWFDDEDDRTASPEHVVPPRPKAATVLSLWFWLGGFSGAAFGAVLIYGGATEASSLFIASGVLEVILGVFAGCAAWGLWRLMRWGRACALLLCWLNVALQSLNIGILAYIRLRGFEVDPVYPFGCFIGFLMSFGLVIYFDGNAARRIFNGPSQAVTNETRT